jgi:hypothetical protein
MALRIVKAYEPMLVERIILTLYGGPGMRKTTIANTAEAPLTLDFDAGSHRATNRKDTAPILTWMDAAKMQASDFAGYSTAVVDTVGRALDKLSVQLIADDPKNATNAGALSLQGYGALKAAFVSWLDRLRSYGLDVVLVLHATEEKRGDDVLERLDVQGGSRGEIHKASDAMGRVYVQAGENWLNFNPTDAAFGKNPGRMGPLLFTGPEKDPKFLANIITEIKRVLNEQSEEVRAMRGKVEAALVEFGKLAGAEAFTAEAAKLTEAKAPHAIKAALIQAAGEKGLEFSRAEKKFVPKPTPEEQAAATGPVTSDRPGFFGNQPAAQNTQEPAAPASTGRRKQGGGTRARRG